MRVVFVLCALLLLCSGIYGATAAETYTFTAKWSTSGQPSDVALDGAGNVYVADMQNNRIQKFTSDGTPVTSWGTFGTANGQFKQPWGVAVDSAGNVYVTDYWNHRVQKFDSNGGYLTQWGGTGTADGQFATSTPMGGLAVDSAGNVYVADQNNNRIQKFSSTGTFLAKWGTVGSGDGQFRQPQDVAIDGAGNVYVTDKGNSRIQKFTSSGTFLAKWGSSGPGDGQFVSPWGITVDSAGNVFVVEQSFMYVGGYPGPIVGMRVQKFDPNGGFITKFGGYSPTLVDGLFNGPRNAAVDSAGTVYVADTGNNRIQEFNRAAVLPVADFTVNATSGKVPLTVAFTDTSTGSPTSWAWTFGDSAISTDQNPVHTYTTAGTFTVALSATNADGTNSVTKTELITASPLAPPVADFTVNATAGKVPLTVAFTDTSTNTPDTWSWEFGDSATSTEQNPVHTYASAGTYTVALTVTNADGTDTVTKTDLIIVAPLTPPVADFTANTTSGTVPLPVEFTDTSSGVPTAWSWTFGDGSTATEQNPVHTYATAGTFTVTLSATNADGTDSVTKTDLITVNPLVPPVADFTVNATAGKVPMTVAFTDTSTGSPTSWAWTFGDTSTSTEQNPVHTYATAGTFTVTLTVTNADGTDSVTKTDLITASPLSPPTAGFTVNATAGKVPMTVAFTDTSGGAPATWSWTFGDGSTGAGPNPVHTYTAVGTYSVALTVTNADGSDIITKTNLITVTAPVPVKPVAKFDTSANTGQAPLTIQFTDRSTGNPTSWQWTFGDGARSSEKNPVHVFKYPGTYSVSLKVTNSAGSATTKRTITVQRPKVDAQFTTDVKTGKAPLTVRFTDLSIGNPIAWLWSFGDGSISTTKNPSHTYKRKGTYSVTLYVFNGWDGDTQRSARLITVT